MKSRLQPTASTARIAASKPQQQQASGSGLYSRHKRPKSCKYDTYRLRSRYSQVEENLFGEPLKNKLMARSRSMETITHEDNANAVQPEQTVEQQPTLFTRREGANGHRPKHLCNREDVKRPERPRTALATMRHSGNSQHHPEFERRSSGQGGHEPGIGDVQL